MFPFHLHLRVKLFLIFNDLKKKITCRGEKSTVLILCVEVIAT